MLHCKVYKIANIACRPITVGWRFCLPPIFILYLSLPTGCTGAPPYYLLSFSKTLVLCLAFAFLMLQTMNLLIPFISVNKSCKFCLFPPLPLLVLEELQWNQWAPQITSYLSHYTCSLSIYVLGLKYFTNHLFKKEKKKHFVVSLCAGVLCKWIINIPPGPNLLSVSQSQHSMHELCVTPYIQPSLIHSLYFQDSFDTRVDTAKGFFKGTILVQDEFLSRPELGSS